MGTIINKRGAKTGTTSGKILSTNSTITTKDITYTNLTKASYSSSASDSGGLVYSYVSSTKTRYTLGIHKGASSSNRYFSKANEIKRVLNVEGH